MYSVLMLGAGTSTGDGDEALVLDAGSSGASGVVQTGGSNTGGSARIPMAARDCGSRCRRGWRGSRKAFG
jgi:hypothetical protein